MNPNLLKKLKERLRSNKSVEEEKALAEKEARFKRAEKAAKEYSIRQAKRLRGEKVEEPEVVEEVRVSEESKKEEISEVKEASKTPIDTKEEPDEIVNDNYQAAKKFPVKQRLFVIFILSVLAIFLGLGIGYSVLGEGRFVDVFKPSTWTHLYKIING